MEEFYSSHGSTTATALFQDYSSLLVGFCTEGTSTIVHISTLFFSMDHGSRCKEVFAAMDCGMNHGGRLWC